MFVGHFALGFAAKRAAPRINLGVLFIAAQLLDLLWPILLIAGVEHVRLAPGITRFTPLDFYDYPISHSILMVLLWGVIAGAGWLLFRHDRMEALVLGLLVVSHAVLDVITHRPDIPLHPGESAKIGMGLWNSVPGTLIVELSLFAAGVFLYVRGTRARDRIGSIALWTLIAFLLLIYAGNVLGPPPPNVDAIGWAGLAMWLLVAWGAWADRHRIEVED